MDLGTKIEETLDEMRIECNHDLELGEYYDMIDNCVITRNYGIKLPRKRATGIKGILGMTIPTISLSNIAKRINEKWGVLHNQTSPEGDKYYVRYEEYSLGFVETVNLYLDELVQKSKRPIFSSHGRPVFNFGIYKRETERLISQGYIL